MGRSKSLTRDKQLNGIRIQEVRQKRDADQALNLKEFAVLAGISYSVARDGFHSTGFPAVHGMVFWEDFVLWRRAQNCKKLLPAPIESNQTRQVEFRSSLTKSGQHWPHRAAKILAGSK